MKFLRILKVAFKNIISNKLRSILTMLGLIIGIASVIILVGVSNGSAKSVRENIQSLGTDILTANINSQDVSLEYSDMEEIAALPGIIGASAYKQLQATVSRGKITSNNARVIATDDKYLDLRNLKLEKGRTISFIDIEQQSKVCIIGKDVKETLFNLGDPVGETIKLNGDNYLVIGVLGAARNINGNKL